MDVTSITDGIALGVTAAATIGLATLGFMGGMRLYKYIRGAL